MKLLIVWGPKRRVFEANNVSYPGLLAQSPAVVTAPNPGASFRIATSTTLRQYHIDREGTSQSWGKVDKANEGEGFPLHAWGGVPMRKGGCWERLDD